MAYRQQLTNLGRDALAEAQAGAVLRFTKMELGEGLVEFDDIPEMTALVAVIMQTGIAAVEPRTIGQVTITSKVPIHSIPRVFDLNEIGIFATVGDKPEILYCVCAAEEGKGDILSPLMAGGSTSEHTIAVAVIIGNTENVEAVFDPDVQIVNIGLPTVGPGFYSRRTGNTFEFKRAVAAGEIQITEDAETVRFNVPIAAPWVYPGTILLFAGATAPAGHLLCNGASYPRTQFPELAAVLGSTYGGDATNFNVPDLRGRTPIGAGAGAGLTNRLLGASGGTETHVLTEAQLALHAHAVADYTHAHGVGDPWHTHGKGLIAHTHYLNTIPRMMGTGPPSVRGIEEISGPLTQTYATNSDINIHAAPTGIGIHAGGANIAIHGAGGNAGHPNMQPFLTLNYIIKT